ncbi:MAG: response regulator [Alphaproteobacteria bacterium]|uniref:response regulator n=1 Tax=Hyphomonas sp. TaxID=87 RepID=UPI001D9A257F|nr:response regulator [Alphaproteobacteria bacterium]MBU2082528.1 response regulator [Alphaproteobacteria bacterium]MBU2142832.1 response regulator [Alphaproteobacteria bacterium]MBU2195254.1 response regulator [Alphaproteobacteria bacterium]
MKVLWVEDHEPVRDMLAIAADKAARSRIQVDLVLAPNLMAAEARLRLERFDLVVLDLGLPDSVDPDMTIARVANMGKYRIAVVSSMDTRDQVVEAALRCGANIAPKAVFKANLPFNRFIQRPDSFEDFLLEQMPAAAAPARAA